MITPDKEAANAALEAFRLDAQSARNSTAHPAYIVEALGRQFTVSAEMARIFLRQAERAIASDESALVVLRHHHGLELLLITDDNSFTIRAATAVE